MFNVWSFKGLGAVVSSGLGGGSLIYANVLLRKPEKWFVKEDLANGGYEHWPVSRDDLDPHYDRVEAMLNGQRYPFADTTPKTAAMTARGGEAGPRVHPSQACCHLRQRRGRPGRRRPDPGGASEPPRRAPLHVPAWSASATSAATSARRTRSTSTTSPRRSGTVPRSARGTRSARSRRGRRWLQRPLRRARRRRRGPQARHARPAVAPRAGADLRPPGSRRRDARVDVPAPQEPRRVPRPERASGQPLRRQRRPPHLRARRRSAARTALRPGDHRARSTSPTRSTAARAAASTSRTPVSRSSWAGSSRRARGRARSGVSRRSRPAS